jgi:diguanylate cyclase (GGDEF)-like protein/PAS domain S-box-containing protein
MNKNIESKKELELLKSKIRELEALVNILEQSQKESELLDFPWIGNLGRWNWLIQSNEVHFNPAKATNLGYSLDELPEKVGFEFFTQKLHPDDYDDVMQNMRNHLEGRSNAYEVEYRIKRKDGSYAWYYDRGKVSKYTDKNTPLIISGIVFDVSKNKELELELKIANEKLKQIAFLDELTHLANRRLLLEKLESEYNRANRYSETFSIVMVDIDHFKRINDTYGHNTGDLVLQNLANILSSRARDTDVVSRWGGEEFIILLPHTNIRDAKTVAESIRQAVSHASLGINERVTISLGVSEYRKSISPNKLIEEADCLLYEAKCNGRNCTCCSK